MAVAVIESRPRPISLSRSLDEFSFRPAFKKRRVLGESAARSSSYSSNLSVWHLLDSELKSFENEHHRFWWKRGKVLAILLHSAGYATDAQYRDLKFFAQVVSPHLGVAQETSGKSRLKWPSFMTDNGDPIELSWDWGTDDKSPTVRYSIEPIGLHAGTALDPKNLRAAPALHKQLVESLPAARQEWYHHFSQFFNLFNGEKCANLIKDMDDHSSTIFYAFDLLPAEVTAKVYFFPKFRAALQNRPNLDVLCEAVSTAPQCTRESLGAWSAFYNFASEPRNQGLEHEMLAIDLIDPKKSRLKVYFRCRDTTLDSVINIMTLGGRVTDPMVQRGLADLSRLWHALFGVDDHGRQDEPLRGCGHRTAGILYNIEFRLGDSLPAAKIYIPVRHYARSDDAVMSGLDRYFQSCKRGKYMADYAKMMGTLCSPESLRSRSGVQTYVGASIRPDGRLRVVSYFKSDMAETLCDA